MPQARDVYIESEEAKETERERERESGMPQAHLWIDGLGSGGKI